MSINCYFGDVGKKLNLSLVTLNCLFYFLMGEIFGNSFVLRGIYYGLNEENFYILSNLLFKMLFYFFNDSIWFSYFLISNETYYSTWSKNFLKLHWYSLITPDYRVLDAGIIGYLNLRVSESINKINNYTYFVQM